MKFKYIKNIQYVMLAIVLVSCNQTVGIFVDSSNIIHCDNSCNRIIQTCIIADNEKLWKIHPREYCGNCINESRKEEIENGILAYGDIKMKSAEIEKLYGFVKSNFNDVESLDIYSFIDLVNENDTVRQTIYRFIHSGTVKTYEMQRLCNASEHDFQNVFFLSGISYKSINPKRN